VNRRALVHLRLPKDGGDLHQSLSVVVRVEDRKFASEDREKDDSSRPDVNGCGDREPKISLGRVEAKQKGEGDATNRRSDRDTSTAPQELGILSFQLGSL